MGNGRYKRTCVCVCVCMCFCVYVCQFIIAGIMPRRSGDGDVDGGGGGVRGLEIGLEKVVLPARPGSPSKEAIDSSL